MNYFRLVPKIEKYDYVDSFLSAYLFTDEDFILLSESVYHTFFEGKLHTKHVVFRSQYGGSEPTSSMVNALIKDFLNSGCKRIFAIGGGSTIDMAKVLLVAVNADVETLFTNPKDLKHNYELIAIPTTCGAGSEVSNISIVELEGLHTKLGLAKDELFPDVCILIPQLLQGLKEFSFKTSAIDGLIHGIESFLSSKSNCYVRLFQEKCISMYLEGFQELVQTQTYETLYEPFLIASNMAGIAFSNTGTGAVHAISYPLSGAYHVTHGLANAIFLIEVLKMYERYDTRKELSELKACMAKALHCNEEEAITVLETVLQNVLEIPSLKSLGMKEEEIELFADSVIALQQRLLSNSYISLNKEQIMQIYRNLW